MHEKQTEIDKFDDKLMNLKDEQLDYESKMEKRFDSNDQSGQDLAALKEKLNGKD